MANTITSMCLETGTLSIRTGDLLMKNKIGRPAMQGRAPDRTRGCSSLLNVGVVAGSTIRAKMKQSNKLWRTDYHSSSDGIAIASQLSLFGLDAQLGVSLNGEKTAGPVGTVHVNIYIRYLGCSPVGRMA
ncbi:hypothetical protein I7I51_06183 [Histoplasma capsulatum]|uniref:Uncharacterized protein n=1 Tax=Ajellomyces capsulatus TaxID=5037 RepID=A0A8A1MH62_AJECA|nr:hypothetical protein I7I51_06183 [Histoplasma capsulatum]